ncbi:MAG: T9SS type A sorting domain-containing protein [Bacteroidetes bacterium]|nr:T9SS type A sorting domain-containing protein [Bacteroidota bacterium]
MHRWCSICKNITINAGATLRIKTGASLAVCGNFTNFGTLICEPGSTVQFIGNTVQTITGILTGANSFANLTISKGGGSVTLANNIDVTQNFLISSATSIFNINAKYMRVGGNFTNNTGNTTFTGYTGSTLEFNGAAAQTFTNANGSLIVGSVFMNKSAGNLYLSGANSTMNIDSTSILTLTSGLINTRALATLEVNQRNRATNSIVGYSAASFIDGKLRRTVYANVALTLPMSIDFPVGDTLNPGGYNMANITFISGTTINSLQGTFNSFVGGVTPLGPTASECMIANYNSLGLLNNGYWTFTKGNASFNGIYRITANNIGYNNNLGSNGWTIAKSDQAANPNLAASWSLIGQCVISSTVASTQRINFNGQAAYSVTTTIGSNVVYTANTTALSVGSPISGTGIPGGSTITAILNSGAFVISNAATASGTVTGSINTTANAATSFNANYAVAQSQVPLPIKLLSFDAQTEGENVVCKWVTASETNNDHFDIERSLNGESFEKIGQVAGFGAGVSTTNRSYSFTDPDKCNEVRYYRLLQVDIDGRSEYSETIAINCNDMHKALQVHPNPAAETITYEFLQSFDDVLEVKILDMTGRLVKEETINVSRGFNSAHLDINELATGSYYLQLRSASSVTNDTPRQIQFMKN